MLFEIPLKFKSLWIKKITKIFTNNKKMIQFISFVFGTLNLAQLQFWEDVAAVPQLSCDKKNVKIFTNKVGSEKNTN